MENQYYAVAQGRSVEGSGGGAANEAATEAVGTNVDWKELVRRYQRPSASRAGWQLVNSIGGYVALWVAMYFTLSWSWLATGLLAVVAGGFMVRIFIIFHDCGHGSFFGSRWANAVTGFVTGVLTFTPYVLWRGEHAQHHATAGDLDRRGVGDVPTMTVAEYVGATPRKRLLYRLVRNPLVLFGIGPLFMFLIVHRIAQSDRPKDRASVLWTNVAIVGLTVGMSFLFGFWQYLALQVLAMAVAGSAGTWLFYIQHQFEGVLWERTASWDFADAALKGSSYYRLPKVLQWFSGNIGFHHIHHLSPRIPNYNLERCHRAEPLFNQVPAISLRDSLASLRYRFWDEEARQLIGFREMRAAHPGLE